MKTRPAVSALALLFLLFLSLPAEELPVPTYANSIIVSIEHSILDSDEVDYIMGRFNFGLYAWPCFSRTYDTIHLDWHSSPAAAPAGIQAFKNTVDSLIAAARAKDAGLHFVICSGLARGLWSYNEAKTEDIRNGQWYNDNNLAANDPTLNLSDFNTYVFGTFSRYARKLRANLEAKAKAAVAFLKQRMDENPDVLIVVSGWGEAELNFHRIDGSTSLQDFFCDYSPFAVLEFRDWIRHTGLYDDISGIYKGQGYTGGGTRYQGTGGLSQFNADFGTAFATWDLKYYNWSLADDYDTDPTDYINNDPHLIPTAAYSHGNMMPASGPEVIAGGFDPPREMGGPPGYPDHSDYWDLWNLFRETTVYNLVNEMAVWAQEAGLPAEKWFTHQIPGDYLFGTNPGTPYKNARYYTSASPLWSADIQPYGSMGATIYDIKFRDPDTGTEWFVRTTQYGIPAISQMSPNWAIMEFDPETYPIGMGVSQSTPAFIYEQYLNAYNYGCHFFNFWRWMNMPDHNIKGTNKEPALADFIEAVRDKARNTNLNTVYDPPKVKGLSGSFVSSPGTVQLLNGTGIQLSIEPDIWDGHAWEWTDWGDFSHFNIYRSTEPGFTADSGNFLATASGYTYTDSAAVYGNAYFYKVKAVNTNGASGPASDEVMLLPTAEDVAVLYVNKKSLLFGASASGPSSPPERVFVINLGAEGTTLDWQAASGAGWITADPPAGSGESGLDIGVSASGLSPGLYQAQVTVSDSAAFNSPQLIDVALTVYDSGDDDPPFGVFDTPVDGSTVSGSVAVTGWALDDIGINKVEIKREPDPDDPPAAIGADGLVYIGDAVFVKNSRPDVQALYPGYPQSSRSGWGYMMLTFGLPRLGNGTFRLYAVAEDLTGKRRLLGTKQITSDNANRTQPFGTIDTPGQGGTASGNYVNFGWALTPPPKYIPTDGSTIWISIDGVFIANPSYNHFRQDIYDSFPGYLNRDGAVGYYYIDTTQYANGTHTIGWYAVDNEGSADGFGSRFFEIQNLGGAALAANRLKSLKYSQDNTGRLRIGVEGPRELEVEQLDRIEIRLQGTGGGRFIGWGETEQTELPVGSTLDEEKGIFYWSVGQGFLNTHVLHFAVTDGKLRSRPIRVTVNIRPKKYDSGQHKVRKFRP